MPGALESSPVPEPLNPDTLVNLLSHSFSAFVAATDPTTGTSTSEARQATESLQQLQRAGVCGRGGLQAMQDLHSVIAWEHMMPDQFCKFYRFAFHLCKEPSRKHVLAGVAIDAWSLIMAGRFRLLDKWLDFVRSRKGTMQVINEDQWRQLLDFSRSVYEDLSNFDPNGAWACCLDEFVDHMRHTRSCMWDEATDSLLGFNGMDYLSPLCMAPVSPHCGSKRRPPDPIPVDPVCEQLNSIHLPHSPEQQAKCASPAGPSPSPHTNKAATPKRLCVDPQQQAQQHRHHHLQHQQQQQQQHTSQLQGECLNEGLSHPTPSHLPPTTASSGLSAVPCGSTMLGSSLQGSLADCSTQCAHAHAHSPTQCALHSSGLQPQLSDGSCANNNNSHGVPLQEGVQGPSCVHTHAHAQATSRQCMGMDTDLADQSEPCPLQLSGSGGCTLELPVLHLPQRRHVKPRRMGVTEQLVQESVNSIFGFSQHG